MDFVTLGRTGLRASVAGLGCGGASRLGQGTGATTAESVRVVREALDLGINLIDTAEAYQTESIVGEGIRGFPRNQVVLSTKRTTGPGEFLERPDKTVEALEQSLTRLGTDYVDIYHMHGVSPATYPEIRKRFVPLLLKLRDQGKIRHLGITEAFASDPGHEMLQLALEDDCWDVVMVGFNILNQSARERVFRKTREKGIGTLIMFAVRRALSQPQVLREVVAQLQAEGRIGSESLPPDDPLGFLLDSGAASIPDAAYRFCRHEPGADVILTGTGNVAHLWRNCASINAPPLPEAASRALRSVFAGVDHISGN